MVETQKRSVEVRVKLAPDLASEFSGIAASRGLLPATLAAVALGEFVEKYRQQVQLQRMVAVDMGRQMAQLDEAKIGEAIGRVLADPEALKLIAAATAEG